MVDQRPVRLSFLKRTEISRRFEGEVAGNVRFGLLEKHSHDSCRGDLFIPRGSLLSISELYDGVRLPAGVPRPRGEFPPG